jgi:hypothetical protein
VQVIRANGTNIQGDRITVSGLVDAATGQAVGTVSSGPVSQIAAAHRSVQDSGAYRCYAFWSHDEDPSATSWTSKYNYVDTAGGIGTQANFIAFLGIGSRAFDHDGRVFVWGAFGGESAFGGMDPSDLRATPQNSYFLFRDDATLHSKAAFQRGGGLSPSVGRLPGVALTSGTTIYTWCATERRLISISTSGRQKGFDKRAPHPVVFEFDSNAARRCARLGETLYVSGGEILQYDGVALFEVGFHVYPWHFEGVVTGAGNIEDGVYTYKGTWRHENGKGEMDRSTTATHGDVTISTGPDVLSFTVAALTITRKLTTKPVAVELWRTQKNPPDGAPFFLVTSKDPANATNPNRHLPNDTSGFTATFDDSFADATLGTKEANPENGSTLENLAPPGAGVIAATETRIFLGAVAGDPDRVWYSKLREAGQVAAFHDTLRIDVPPDGGEITGLAFQNGILVVFRERAAYMFPGDGFDNNGFGQNYGPPQVLSYDVGCRDTDSIVITPEGIAFHSSKGKYLLTRGWTMKPIGLPVCDYDSETVLAAHVVTAQHQVRWLTASRMLVWDYLIDAWAEWTIASGVHATLWQGAYQYLLDAGPRQDTRSFAFSTFYGMDVETAWIKPNDLQGAAAFRNLLLLAEFRSACHVRFRVAYDYSPTWVDDNYVPTPSVAAGQPVQLEIPTSRRKAEALKLRATVVGAPAQATFSTTASVALVVDGDNPEAFWQATFTAIPLGSLGNDLTLTVRVDQAADGDEFIDVRDHQTVVTASWAVLANNVGVWVRTATGEVSIADIEAAINAYSDLLNVTAVHPHPAVIDVPVDATGGDSTSGGQFGSPTGESLKITGLGLEIGIQRHLHKRFTR